MSGRVEAESRIETLRASGDLSQAATVALEVYGPEVLGFLASYLHDEDLAREAFSQTCEDLWRGLPTFEGRSSVRTWLYVLARGAAARTLRSPHLRRGRFASLTAAEALAEQLRSRTAPFQRSEVKDRVAALRASLDPDDRALLVLRVDRGLSWAEVAAVMEPDAEGEAVTRASAKLRKRFQVLKDELRARAVAAGIVLGEER